MKKLMISLILALTVSLSVNAMNSSDARRIARFLTDKMAYELNLTDEQYEAAYEVNYDYFLNLEDYNDLYGNYWTRRNIDLSYILGNAKYLRFKSMYYFYRPAYWNNSQLRYRIYSRFSNRNKYYFNQPSDYSNYNSEHSWKQNNGRSYYKNQNFNDGTGMRSNMGNGNSGSYNRRSGTMNSNSNSRMSGNYGNSRMNNNENTSNNNRTNSFGNGSRNRNNGNIGNNNNDNNNNGNNRSEMNNNNRQNQNNDNDGNRGNNKNNGHIGNGNSQNGNNSKNTNNEQPNR